MGLDMWMYGIKDISDEDIPDNMPQEWYEEHDYKLITHYENDDDFDKMYGDMYIYSAIRNVEYIETDMEKLKKDYKINENAHLSSIIGGKLGFSYNKKSWEIEISEDEIKKYDKKVFRKALIFKADELAYWRKEYNLQDLIYTGYHKEIYNCGFHEIDDDLMEKINRYLEVNDMDKQNINDDGYIAKMYHEWY